MNTNKYHMPIPPEFEYDNNGQHAFDSLRNKLLKIQGDTHKACTKTLWFI